MTTLPKSEDGEHWNVGDRFIVRGEGFDRWPSEVVLTYDEATAVGEGYPSIRLLGLIEKTDSMMVFEVKVAYTFHSSLVWSVFASPYNVPREVLGYEQM